MFREIAANMNSTFLAVLNGLVGSGHAAAVRVDRGHRDREDRRVREASPDRPGAEPPLVLRLPDHLDGLLRQPPVPPHIAARENMAFGPFGFLFRRGGRVLPAPLVRRPALQGGVPRLRLVPGRARASPRSSSSRAVARARARRCRRGSACSPGTSRPSSAARAAISSSCPSPSPTSGWSRRARWSASSRARQKSDESMLGLVRARKYLQRRFGSVHVNFGEPISLADALGDRRERFARERRRRRSPPRSGAVRRAPRQPHRRAHQLGGGAQRHRRSAACALLGERAPRSLPRRPGAAHAGDRRPAAPAGRAADAGARCRTRGSSPSRSRRCCAAT